MRITPELVHLYWCPFCRCNEVRARGAEYCGSHGACVVCHECGAQGPYCVAPTQHEARLAAYDAWNKRAKPDKPFTQEEWDAAKLEADAMMARIKIE
jgi:hypothetical protein